MNLRIRSIIRVAGPGILFASTAIGVSHLIQSTRAGAEFGLVLMIFVVLSCLLKYPAFEYGLRYANATGTSIIDGYMSLGKTKLWMFFGATLTTMFFVTGAVMFVTAGFFAHLFSIESSQEWITIMLFVVCVSILAIGRYGALDGIIKIVATVMLVSTVMAFAIALWNGPTEMVDGFVPESLWTDAGLFFLLALMGFMPAPIEVSAWTSLWALARAKQTGYRPKLQETLSEFRVSYAITATLAVMFMVLGSYLFFGSGEELSNSSADFAHQVVTLYTETIGPWSSLVISASAFAIMFGTILAILDGYTRSITKAISLIMPGMEQTRFAGNLMNITLLVLLSAG